MQLEEYLDFRGPDTICIKGHQIGLEHVVACYWEGHSPEQIARHYPNLSAEKVYGAITYYLHNKAAVDAYIERVNKIRAEHPPGTATSTPTMRRTRALREVDAQEQQQTA